MRPPRTCRPKVDLVPRPRFRCANVELVPLVRGRAGPEPAEPRVSGVCARGGADGGKVGALALALSERLLAIRPSCATRDRLATDGRGQRESARHYC